MMTLIPRDALDVGAYIVEAAVFVLLNPCLLGLIWFSSECVK